jgi:uncharacterized protein (TIGR02996 family)
MTPEEQALLDAVCADPYDNEPRLAYAAWLDKQTPPDPQGLFIRASILCEHKSLSQLYVDAEQYAFLRAEADHSRLRYEYEADWKQSILQIAQDCKLDRGLVAGVTIAADTFLARGAELMRMAPIVHVDFTQAKGLLPKLLACEALAKIRALSLSAQGLTSDDVALLASSDKLKNVWWLDLSLNDIDLDGVRAMAKSPNLGALRHCELSGNPGNVHERAGTEGYTVTNVWFPPEGRDLEEELGPIPWLHYHPATYDDFPPDPCRTPLR